MCASQLPPLSDRVGMMEASGVRKVFDLARSIDNPVNLSIGQPHFDVPDEAKEAAVEAIRAGKNAYTQTQGGPELRAALIDYLPQRRYQEEQLLVVCGVSGGLTLAFLALLNPGDEIITSDPYFVSYKQLTLLCGGKPVYFNTYPDFRLDPDRIAACVTPRTKAIVLSSPCNPTGVIYTEEELKGLTEVARKHNLLVISDEIYTDYAYDAPAVSIADYYENTMIMGGFSKSHAMTGWRLGYVAGPSELIAAMTKLQQFTYVCAPSFAQVAAAKVMGTRMTEAIADYKQKRDRIYTGLVDAGYEVTRPEGAFYVFPKAPWGTDMEFVTEAIRNKLLIIPGSTFSEQDTHFRISYAAEDDTIERGLEILAKIAGGPTGG
ncbi:MAG: aminotransferase class I/II-fold pyridoxal phosphate-dependent enzyme [Planctomycetes bacterium]|nr:aminotransferase class I/II-fold pyridoxal phosphate-dependent enzyme [Planctomycetota bacterium]